MAAIISPLALQAASVFGAQTPSEGPKFARVALDFVSNNNYSLDLQSWQAQGGSLSMIQSLYIDNSGNDTPMTIAFQGSNQQITVKGRTQGYFSAISPNPPKLLFSSNGATGPGVVFLLNFPTGAGQQWATQ